MKELPVWYPSTCEPSSSAEKRELTIDIASSEIKTLEGIYAGLTTSNSSGRWGDSGGIASSMQGTPIGADIIYFSNYEDKFYRLKVDFDVEYMKKAVKEIHYSREAEIYEWNQINTTGDGLLGGFNGLVFGFAPDGMVVVWLSYGTYQKELERFQAQEYQDLDKKFEKKMFPDNGMSRKDVVAMYYKQEIATCTKWDKYRKRYNLKIEATSPNKGFRLFESRIENYNGEFLFEFRPEILNQKYSPKALPKRIIIYWETGLNQKFQGNLFFNENTIFDIFKNVKINERKNLQIKISEDNHNLEILLDNEPIKMDSIKIWRFDGKNGGSNYKDSYK